MIGHYLLTLTPEQESDVLTQRMGPAYYFEVTTRTHCLVGAACGASVDEYGFGTWARPNLLPLLPVAERIEERYDRLCARFGTVRANAAIRNRILSNRARRTLRNAPQLEAV